MSKLPEELEKIRDEWAINSPYKTTFERCRLAEGFDAGALAMREYMQAEMDKLERELHNIAKLDVCYSERPDAMWLMKWRNDTKDRASKVLASYRAWKEKNI